MLTGNVTGFLYQAQSLPNIISRLGDEDS